MIEISVPVCLENESRKPFGVVAMRGRGFVGVLCLALLMGCGVALLSMTLASMAYAQQPAGQMQLAPSGQPEPEAAKPSAAPDAPMPAQRPGLFDAMRSWFESATPKTAPNLQSAQDALNDLGTRARDASDAAIRATQESAARLSTIPVGGSVTGNELCAVAANGAPDCEAAAIRLCQSKGLKGGKSADFVSAEKCSAQALLSGRKDAGSCKTETFVTRAVCQ
jgi:hypothetical protein